MSNPELTVVDEYDVLAALLNEKSLTARALVELLTELLAVLSEEGDAITPHDVYEVVARHVVSF